jgi:N-methylhydantoinase A/oxoprolinase/acetone carboxylase beta subunit
LHEEDFEPIIARIVEEHIKAVAVCFVHAYINPLDHSLARSRKGMAGV